MRGRTTGGVRVSGRRPGEPTARQVSAEWHVYEGGRPMRMREQIASDEKAGVAVGYTCDGMIYAVIGDVYAETSVSEIAHAVTDALEA